MCGQAENSPAPVSPTVVIADGEQVALDRPVATVGEALQNTGIVLGEMDRVEPALDKPVAAGQQIRVTRVEAEFITEETSDPRKVVVLGNRDLPAGTILKVREGADGKVRKEIRIWRKDGQETLREVVSTKVLKRRVDTVEMRGTTELASRSGTVRNYITMSASAYDPGPRSCGPHATGHTATGMHATYGVVAVDPRVIPLGTRLYVEGYGVAIAADTGGAIKGRRIDLCYDTYAEAIQYGRRTVKVYILD
jgi:3D (Asp-Asp-Asp) domain-containing protein